LFKAFGEGSPPGVNDRRREMFDEIELGREFFEGLTAIDRTIVERAAEEACVFCGGPLHRGDYPRKPRGGMIGAAAEAFQQRYSLCCGREGCRKRATPPSMRFLGRRVYVGAVVVAASVIALAAATGGAARRATGIAARTTRRWLRWWRGPFTQTRIFVEIAARLAPLSRRMLPTSLVAKISGGARDRVRKLLGYLAPLTTGSSPDGSRLLRGLL
jgi:hypothetical protein